MVEPTGRITASDKAAPGLASMTAFARSAATSSEGSLSWEMKAVNGKGLDLRLRLPAGFDAHEAGIRSRVGAVVTRGSVQAVLTVQRATVPPQVRIDPVLLGSLIASVAAAVPPGTDIGGLTLDGLLAIRGVVDVVEPTEPGNPALVVLALAVLDEALEGLQSMRQSEGEALGALLGQQLTRIDALVAAAEDAPGRTPQAIRDRLARSVALLMDQAAAFDSQRLHQEAILLATRADVREELDRLRLHRASAQALLDAGGPVGRRLDFLAQELAREANTLCAKSNDAALTTIGLDLRNQIEQFREQVQNLE